MKMIPNFWPLLIDKILAILCFFMYWTDICEMYQTSMEFIYIPIINVEKEKEKEEKIKRQKEALKKAKEIIM